MKHFKLVEYIWLDGNKPVCLIRSKARMVELSDNPKISDFPMWSFDGSSTMQAETGKSDCLIKPVTFVTDPLQNGGDYLVLCEVLDSEGKEHQSNTRFALRRALAEAGDKADPWIGFEQEYTLFKRNIPLGWPEHGYPAPQGPYYCGVGTEQIFGRDLVMEHAHACIKAGILLYGINAEVMPGQWEFQIGYRGNSQENVGALNVCDQMWIARWLIHRISEKYGVHVSLHNKPVKGDWNGAGMHSNFSTAAMRDKSTGAKAIAEALDKLQHTHKEHIEVYGDKLEERLTGHHETSSIHKFSYGVAHRGCSVRIPPSVKEHGYGYIEDRRPGANADPYLVAARLVLTVCS